MGSEIHIFFVPIGKRSFVFLSNGGVKVSTWEQSMGGMRRIIGWPPKSSDEKTNDNSHEFELAA